MSVKKLKFKPEQLSILLSLYNLMKKHSDIETEEHNIVACIKTQYDIVRNQYLVELGVKNDPNIMSVNIELEKNEIVIEETPVVVKANTQTMKDVANAQRVIDGLKGKKIN